MIQLHDISYHYPDGTPGLSHADLTLEKGECCVLTGPNGCGKSTLFRILNGLAFPQSGSYLLDGQPVTEGYLRSRSNAAAFHRRIGYLFQNSEAQLFTRSVEDEIAFGLWQLDLPEEEVHARTEKYLRMLSLETMRHRAPFHLSGGEKKRCALAAVLAMEPEALILDEATAMLDPRGRKEVLDTVQRLNREQGITVVWITHFMQEAATAQRVLVMDHGKIAMDGTPREVFSQVERLRALRLDVPPMTHLAQLLRQRGVDIGMDVLSVDDMVKEVKRLCPSCLNS